MLTTADGEAHASSAPKGKKLHGSRVSKTLQAALRQLRTERAKLDDQITAVEGALDATHTGRRAVGQYRSTKGKQYGHRLTKPVNGHGVLHVCRKRPKPSIGILSAMRETAEREADGCLNTDHKRHQQAMSHRDVHWITNYIWGIVDDILRDLYVRGKVLRRDPAYDRAAPVGRRARGDQAGGTRHEGHARLGRRGRTRHGLAAGSRTGVLQHLAVHAARPPGPRQPSVTRGRFPSLPRRLLAQRAGHSRRRRAKHEGAERSVS